MCDTSRATGLWRYSSGTCHEWRWQLLTLYAKHGKVAETYNERLKREVDSRVETFYKPLKKGVGARAGAKPKPKRSHLVEDVIVATVRSPMNCSPTPSRAYAAHRVLLRP